MAKTLCTPQVTERVCEALRRGYFQKEAAALGGIAEPTYYEWLRRGRQALTPPNGNQPPTITYNEDGTPNLPKWITPRDKPFAVFTVSTTRARLDAEGSMLDVIREVAHGGQLVREVIKKDGTEIREWARPDARAAEWLLERSFRDRWGRAERLMLTLEVIDDAIRREEQKALQGPVIDVLPEPDGDE